MADRNREWVPNNWSLVREIFVYAYLVSPVQCMYMNHLLALAEAVQFQYNGFRHLLFCFCLFLTM